MEIKGWNRSASGTTRIPHAFKEDGTAVCRKNIRHDRFAHFFTLDEVRASTVMESPCLNCLKKVKAMEATPVVDEASVAQERTERAAVAASVAAQFPAVAEFNSVSEPAPVVEGEPATLTAGTRVRILTTGRLGTVNEAAGGKVTIPGHVNFGRVYVDVNRDSVDAGKGLHGRSRPFVDELVTVEQAPEVEPAQCTHGNVPRPDVTGDPIAACRTARGVEDFGVFNDEGCIYFYGCAVDVANEAVKESAESDNIMWSKLCTEHAEQPAGTCEKCHADEDDDPDA
ncbi:hypothetical protein [Streptomyces scopuliridis]|uniref:hypothetical protein n=1 Tax=Streptomyces scopuliridis TaxID=452529 RepID=UPI0036737009